MDQYIPPVYAVGVGAFLVLTCFYLRIPFFVVGVISILILLYALQDHFITFSSDYKNFSAPTFFKNNAPVLIIGVVILLSIGFLILKFGPKAITTNEPIRNDYGKESANKWKDSLLNRRV
jgi:hypothetical protein